MNKELEEIKKIVRVWTIHGVSNISEGILKWHNRKTNKISDSSIKVLKMMIKHYEKRGGGYSQMEALKEAIK